MNNAQSLPQTASDQLYSISNYLYLIRLLAIIAIVLMSFMSWEQAAMHNVVAANEKSLGSLLLMAELKQLLAAVSSIDIAFIEGAVKDIVTSLEKAENLLFMSSILTTLQMLIIKLSMMDVIKYAVVFCFVTSFIGWFQRISLKALLVLLMLSPGLTLYSNTIHFLADDMARVIEGDLYSKLSHLTKTLDKEKNTLLKKHQEDLKKIDHSNSHFKWFHRLVSDVSYDYHDIKDTVSNDYHTLLTVLRGGGKAILKETIGYFTKLMFLTLLLPLGYFYLLYAVMRYAFPKAPFTQVHLLEKLEHDVISDRQHLVADIKHHNSILKGLKQWLQRLLITPIKTKIQQEEVTIHEQVKQEEQHLKDYAEQQITATESAITQAVQSRINTLEQGLRNEIRFIQQRIKQAVTQRVNKLNQYILQLNDDIQQRIHAQLLALNTEVKQACQSVITSLEQTVQHKLLAINDELQSLVRQTEHSLQQKLLHALNGAEQDLQAEQQRVTQHIRATFKALLQHSEQEIQQVLQQLEQHAAQWQQAQLHSLQAAVQDSLADLHKQLKGAETSLVSELEQHAKVLLEKAKTQNG